jgi:N-acetyl sugar amidotransferase
MDTTDPEIKFTEDGFCNHCTDSLKILSNPPHTLSIIEKSKRFDELVQEIKRRGKGKQYDCIIGVSGGIDSTYAAYIVKKAGLRPLAVHLDNGWDAELAVKNIENICKGLDIDLETHVIDWEEFKDIQVSFLKASTPDSEIPSDHAIRAIMYKKATQYGVKYILAGTNAATEAILPVAWSQGNGDWKYIKNVQKRFGQKEIMTFPHMSYLRQVFQVGILKIRWISILDYVDYRKESAKETIIKELNWKDYGGKHHESIYTKFFQTYILPTKFGYDKRRAHLSNLIMSDQITRDEALAKLKEPLYREAELSMEKEFVLKKLSLAPEEFDKIMKEEPKTIYDYPNYYGTYYVKMMNWMIQNVYLRSAKP